MFGLGSNSATRLRVSGSNHNRGTTGHGGSIHHQVPCGGSLPSRRLWQFPLLNSGFRCLTAETATNGAIGPPGGAKALGGGAKALGGGAKALGGGANWLVDTRKGMDLAEPEPPFSLLLLAPFAAVSCWKWGTPQMEWCN